MPGRALLIGASEYGEGFANLLAAKYDVEVMERVLRARRYEEITIVSKEDVQNASALFVVIKEFCQSVVDGVGIVYFSGHGMSVDDQEFPFAEAILQPNPEPRMTTPDWRPRVEDLHRKVKPYRKRGDALYEAGQEEEAVKNYRSILSMLTEMIAILTSLRTQALSASPEPEPPINDAEEWAEELIEAYGLSGGMHRRLGELSASLEAYQKGAKLEETHRSASTYNRVNAVKLALLSGAASLASLRPAIDALESFLTRQLAETQQLSDSAWSWADLGDCRALQGDGPGAERAYRAFVEKAGSQAPKTTLAMLREMDRALQVAGDPNEGAVAQALSSLESRLA